MEKIQSRGKKEMQADVDMPYLVPLGSRVKRVRCRQRSNHAHIGQGQYKRLADHLERLHLEDLMNHLTFVAQVMNHFMFLLIMNPHTLKSVSTSLYYISLSLVGQLTTNQSAMPPPPSPHLP